MVSVVIPARNEKYLQKTIDSILSASRGEIEVIAILDGYWPDPPIKDDPRIILVHHARSIGQRQGINEGARIAKGKYILKTDGHSMFDEGFDVKLAADCEYDWTVIPRMYNLDVDKWKPKLSKVTDFMWIRAPYAKHKPFRHNYWDGPAAREFRKEHKIHKSSDRVKGDICDVMTGQGACFFMHLDRYWELGGCDEKTGSWGQQGVEMALKAWLSGGSLKVNKKTWFAHYFRGGVGFPYAIKGSDQVKARKYSIKFWTSGKWHLQKRDLKWLVNKFAPVPTWEESKKMPEPYTQEYAKLQVKNLKTDIKRAKFKYNKNKMVTSWINKGRVFDVEELYKNRLSYARVNKTDGLQWLNQCFPSMVKRILKGGKLSKMEIEASEYYRYLVSRLNPMVCSKGIPNTKGRFHVVNKIRDLELLCESVKTKGLQSPLDMFLDGEYLVITRGSRRLEIIHQLGWKKVPVRIWRDDHTAHSFIPPASWGDPEKTIHGNAIKHFLEYGAETTDKYWVHSYTPYYDFYMGDKQAKHIKILELGVKTGSSLALWHDSFPRAQIYGIDKDDRKLDMKFIKGRTTLITGDIKENELLHKIGKQFGMFDLIVDDAIHLPKEQRNNYNALWKYLKPGGVYVIEDIYVSYMERFKEISIVDFIKTKVEQIGTDHKIQSVSFFPNICFIRKG